MIYITKCSIYLNFICKYSQVFNVVSSCHVVDVPSVSDFVPKPMNHVRIYGLNRFCYPCPLFFQTYRRGKKTLSLTYPHTEKSRGVKSGDRGGQAIVLPRLVQTTTHNTVHIMQPHLRTVQDDVF